MADVVPCDTQRMLRGSNGDAVGRHAQRVVRAVIDIVAESGVDLRGVNDRQREMVLKMDLPRAAGRNIQRQPENNVLAGHVERLRIDDSLLTSTGPMATPAWPS